MHFNFLLKYAIHKLHQHLRSTIRIEFKAISFTANGYIHTKYPGPPLIWAEIFCENKEIKNNN